MELHLFEYNASEFLGIASTTRLVPSTIPIPARRRTAVFGFRIFQVHAIVKVVEVRIQDEEDKLNGSKKKLVDITIMFYLFFIVKTYD